MAKTLKEYIEERAQSSPKYKVIEETYYKVSKGELRLVDPNPPKSLIQYLSRTDYSAWFYTATSLILLYLLSVYLSYNYSIIAPLRYVLGALYVLFIPGYSMVEALYPEEGRLTELEKLAYSIGLSLALVPLIGILLNYTPWGITLQAYNIASSIIIIILLLIAVYRKYKSYTAIRQIY